MLLYGSISMWVAMILVLWHNRQKKNASIFLAILLFTMGMHGVSHAILLDQKYSNLVPFFYNIWSPLYVLPGPLLFLYVRSSLTGTNSIIKTDWVHMFPLALLVLDAFPYWISPLSYKQTIAATILQHPEQILQLNLNWFIPARTNMVMRPVLMIAYSLLSFKILLGKASTNSIEKKSILDYLNWHIILSLTIFLVGASYMITIIRLNNLHQPTTNSSYFVFRSAYHEIGAMIFIAVPVLLSFFPKVIYGLEITEIKSMSAPATESSTVEEIISEDEEVRLNQLAHRIKMHLEENKPYLNHRFSMDELSRSLDVPRHQVYKCMAKIMKVKFTDLRMQLRIEHAKVLLSSGRADDNKLEAVGLESGFVSRSNFHSAFKTLTGLTPTEYLQSLQEVQPDNP